MKKIFIILLALLMPIQAFALLPPLNQSIVEIETILSDETLTQRLRPNAIEEIMHFDKGYLIQTKEQQLFVEVIYEPATRPGAQKFRLVFHSVEERT